MTRAPRKKRGAVLQGSPRNVDRRNVVDYQMLDSALASGTPKSDSWGIPHSEGADDPQRAKFIDELIARRKQK
jgi:hypothetical protein